MSANAVKFNRDYLLTVGVGPYGPPQSTGGSYIARATQQVVIKPPFAVEFSIQREAAATSQTASIKIKNLAPKTRDVIYKDPFATGLYAEVKLQAGYKGQYLSTIFQGTVLSAESHRENQKDLITQIEALSGGFPIANSYSALTLGPSQDFKQLVMALNGDLYGVSQTPIIGSVPAKLSIRPTVWIGPTFSLLQKALPVDMYATIDNDRLLVMSYTDAIASPLGQTFIISKSTGLLDPPAREGNGIRCRMMFEPRVNIGQYVFINSIDNPMFNGGYQVMGVNHQGIISPSENGPCYTTFLVMNFGKINLLTAKWIP